MKIEEVYFNQIKNLTKNSKYLVKMNLREITLITVLNVTETSYQVKYESGNTHWWEKEETKHWTILEDVTSIIINEPEKQILDGNSAINYCSPKYCSSNPLTIIEPCKICNGTGLLPDENSTVSYKPCYACNGSKLQIKYIINS